MADENKKPATPAEYENYIQKLVYSYEDKLSDQKERIFSLVEENKYLNGQLSVYKDKDAQISKALTIAVTKAKEIEDAAKLKYNMEIERLKVFHHKWVAYYADIKNKIPINDNVLSAEAFLIKMDKILGLDSEEFKISEDAGAMAQFIEENKRLQNIQKQSDINNSAATIPPSESGLDMNEVLNPKNLPELDVLIKEMGILEK